MRDDLTVVSEVIDYLLVTTEPTVPGEALAEAEPAGWDGPVLLGRNIRIEHVDETLADRLVEACKFRGHRWDPVRQFRVVQAFVRDVDETDPRQRHLYAWDEDAALSTALALSRLIRPHGMACDYAVRRIIDSDGNDRLVPHDAGEARVAFVIDDRSRGWLVRDEAQQLAALIATFDTATLPIRVRRALRMCDLAVRERYLEDALLLIVTASGIVHGAHIDLAQAHEHDRFVATVDALQRTLSAAIRTALESREFCAVFATDQAICARWQVRARSR